MTTVKQAAEKHGSALASIPMWVVQAIFGILLTSGVAWVTWATASSWKHETRLSVTETRINKVDESLTEIKDAQKETNKKLDRLLNRR